MKRGRGGEDKNVFVKMNYEDAKEAKKHLLEISEAAIKLQLVSSNIREISKSEIKQRSAIKKSMKEMSSALDHFKSQFPAVSDVKLELKGRISANPKLAEEKQSRVRETTLNHELLEIRRKLESLGV